MKKKVIRLYTGPDGESHFQEIEVLLKDMEKKGLEMGAADSYDAICLAARETLLDIANGSKGSVNELGVGVIKNKF